MSDLTGDSTAMSAPESHVNGAGVPAVVRQLSELVAQVPTSSPKTAASLKPPTIPSGRTLRARPSLTGGAAPSAPTSNGSIKLGDAEIDSIKRRLGPDGVAERRDELIRDKEASVKTVIDEHDTAVREKFHLERFVTMITGWNPAVSIII
jgi:helicase SWR1